MSKDAVWCSEVPLSGLCTYRLREQMLPLQAQIQARLQEMVEIEIARITNTNQSNTDTVIPDGGET